MNVPISPANDIVNFDDPIEARRFIRGWLQNFTRKTGKVATYCDTNAGRIEFDKMTDDEALFVAKDFRHMEQEAMP